ncbi:hypothetical protein FQ192_28785 [Pseudomonas sp. ANT_J12]|uniref:hypothetical protein n=1 Tax=Pseudomonas sp. ANT_J12 TaxID=2597351 RepID=UPI0011F281B5|nr:hypothetical protein [Pseudomonas sp. ANT_J12]KAA0984018.1 hypothetical protein FQ192_28785 [Pseudomonas sp. ANT_J12]
MTNRIKTVPGNDSLAAQPSSFMSSQQAHDQLQAEAIAASRRDSRPSVAAETVFAELYALIDEIEAEQCST